jgi:hypothetical protein
MFCKEVIELLAVWMVAPQPWRNPYSFPLLKFLKDVVRRCPMCLYELFVLRFNPDILFALTACHTPT